MAKSDERDGREITTGVVSVIGTRWRCRDVRRGWHRVTTVQGNAANLDDLDRLYETVAAERGVVDIVFANAGFVELVPIDKVTPEHFDKTVGINLRGLFFTVQKALPLMKHGGSIVLTS